jgi:AbrB family looped-hinge helix DNA binding protein
MIGSKLTIRGQTTIPKPIREYLGLEPGDRVLFVVKEDEVVLQPVRDTLLDLRGSVESRRKPEDFDKVRAEVRKRVSKSRKDG